jgi:uncharacterized protein with HEPN domain
MSERPANLLLRDMIEAAEKIDRYVAGMGQDQFLADEKTVDAVARNLEIIGEAANRLRRTFTAEHGEVEWSSIVGLRHRIVHDYFGLDLDIIWTIVTRDLPSFRAKVQRLLPD